MSEEAVRGAPSSSSEREGWSWFSPEPRWSIWLFAIVPVLTIAIGAVGVWNGEPLSGALHFMSLGLGAMVSGLALGWVL